ncbi:MAG: hypothetical protein HOP10_15470 [Chitinophagaceae bacterium]|nr:hypothetical protein [Chitinophagaceae bacterium]
MTYAYLDWNIFNKIEKKTDTIYTKIEEIILENKILAPYSNAHINDLVRGYEKNQAYIQGHLNIIQKLTKNLCIVQYWGEKTVRWHFRDVFEFFNSALAEIETSPKSFLNLFESFEKDIPELATLWETQLSLLRSQQMPEGFKDLFKADPSFSLMFPKTKIQMNALAFCEDLYEFATNSKKDYSVYKNLRNYVNQSRLKLKKQAGLFKEIDKNMKNIPTYLNFDESWELHSNKSKISDNPVYQKITSVYQKIDFKGFKSDEKFSNMIDDSLHVFYAAHCDFFVTIDDKCMYKAGKTYEELKINTIVLSPEDFLRSI